jgi:DNA-binding HxlR family transcriptional regulator
MTNGTATRTVEAGKGAGRIGDRAAATTADQPADTFGCPVARTAQIMGNKWTPLIVRDLAAGHRRFSELERSLHGISPKTLSERLKRLEEAQVVERQCFAEVPPRVEYSLTPKGFDLLPVIESMREFGLRWLPADDCEVELD